MSTLVTVIATALLVLWFTGAVISVNIVLTAADVEVTDRRGRIVTGVERIFVDVLIILCWPYYMLPAMIRSLRGQ